VKTKQSYIQDYEHLVRLGSLVLDPTDDLSDMTYYSQDHRTLADGLTKTLQQLIKTNDIIDAEKVRKAIANVPLDTIFHGDASKVIDWSDKHILPQHAFPNWGSIHRHTYTHASVAWGVALLIVAYVDPEKNERA
jgi:hypothetical protein